MAIFESTDESFREYKRKEEVLGLQIGKVNKVFEHSSAEDRSNFELNVSLRDEEKERRRVPILQAFDGSLSVPEKDDMVIVGFIDGRGERPIVVGTLYNNVDRAPLGQAGIYRVNKGNVFIEMHPDGNWARLAYRDDNTLATSPPDSRVEMTDTGEIIIDGREPVSVTQTATLSEGGSSAFNYNASSWTVVPWDSRVGTQDADDPLTFSGYNGGDTYLQADTPGIYSVTVDLYLYTPTTGSQFAISLRGTKNGNPLAKLNSSGDAIDTSVDQTPGALTTGGFISNDSNHSHSSLQLDFEVELAENDTLRIESKSAAASGDVYPMEQHCVWKAERTGKLQ